MSNFEVYGSSLTHLAWQRLNAPLPKALPRGLWGEMKLRLYSGATLQTVQDLIIELKRDFNIEIDWPEASRQEAEALSARCAAEWGLCVAISYISQNPYARLVTKLISIASGNWDRYAPGKPPSEPISVALNL